MDLSAENKEVLARALGYYWEKCVWNTIIHEDKTNKTDLASEEDQRLREVCNKLGIRDYLPEEVQRGL